ncbi:hypothetical protein GCM10027448_43160 [Nocardioides dilutus]
MVVAGVEREVGDHEEHGADRGETEETGDLAFRALLLLRVDVSGPPGVGGQTGVCDRLVRRERREAVVLAVAVLLGVAVAFGAHAA